jgi:15-cis-phytoene synthase
VARRALETDGRLMARKTSFYYSFLVLPPDERRAIISVWDFCRAVDDAVDETGPESFVCETPPGPSVRAGSSARETPSGPSTSARLSAREAVQGWREELRRCYEGVAPRTPQGRRLQPFIARFDLPREAFEDVIDGVAMDLDTRRYQTFSDLLEYCRRVASAVGMICIRIFGCRSERSRDYALNLGIALQLTNILRDVKTDLARGRVYLPLEDLASAGCTVDDLAAGRMSEPVRCLMEFECGRAREFYRRAVDARSPEDRSRLVAAEIMRAVYFETLRRIERSGYDVFTARIRVPRSRQALIALRQWLWQT